eukprot:677030_1
MAAKKSDSIPTISTSSKPLCKTGTAKAEIQTVDGQIEFTWSVEGDEFALFLEAKPGEGFQSPHFNYSDGVWKIKCYPNGTKKYGRGDVGLFLAAVRLPVGVVQCGIQYEFECKEVDYKDEYGSELTNLFTKKHCSWGYPETFKRTLFMNLKKKNIMQCTIKCMMKRVLMVKTITVPVSTSSSSIGSSHNSDEEQPQLQDTSSSSSSKHNRVRKIGHTITWFIDSSMIQQFKKASSGSGSNKKSFDSTAFTVHRTTWCLQCYPAGDKYADNGMSSLYLKILEFPDGGGHHIKNMKVRMQFECPDIQYESEEFIHIYENKKQEVYFGISSAFNTLQLNYLSKNQGIVVKCRIDLISVSIAGERWWNCIRERDNLRAKTKRIEHDAKEQSKRAKETTQYVCNKVVTIKEQDAKVRSKMKKLNDESRGNLGRHEKILKAWDKTTALLQKVIDSNCDVLNVVPPTKKKAKAESKEQEQECELVGGQQLLHEYTQCQAIIDEQRNRLELVSKNVYSLLNQQSNLLQSMQQWKENQVTMRDEYTKLLTAYNDVKANRLELQQLIAHKVDECNAQIDEENALNRKKCNVDHDLNAMKLEVNEFEAMSADCAALIERYNVFVRTNNDNLDCLHKYISSKWSEFERTWCDWKAKDIMAFIKYKMNWTQVQVLHIDLDEMANKMMTSKWTGRTLQELDKSELYLVGINNYQLRCQIFDHIRVLRTKYPPPVKAIMKPSGTREEVDNNNSKIKEEQNGVKLQNESIPSKFLCPISHTLMTDPVMAFDGYTYEKTAIEEYLKKHKKSPKTKKEAHTLCTFPNLQMKQEIETYRAINDINSDGDTTFIE